MENTNVTPKLLSKCEAGKQYGGYAYVLKDDAFGLSCNWAQLQAALFAHKMELTKYRVEIIVQRLVDQPDPFRYIETACPGAVGTVGWKLTTL
jgi:hypothetical protein